MALQLEVLLRSEGVQAISESQELHCARKDGPLSLLKLQDRSNRYGQSTGLRDTIGISLNSCWIIIRVLFHNIDSSTSSFNFCGAILW